MTNDFSIDNGRLSAAWRSRRVVTGPIPRR
jgi:hypothetical protein